MSKSILVLGASTYQLPVIKKAKEYGYRVVTTDNIVYNPGHQIADFSYGIDTTDHNGVLHIAKQEKISGIISPGTDVAVVTAAYVAEQLNIPGPSLNASRILTHKKKFRDYLAKTHFLSPLSFRIDNNIPENDLFDGRSWLIKPNQSSGSKGIYIIRSYNDFCERLNESRAFSIDGTALLEQFIEGTQHTCEGILVRGKIKLALLTDRDTASYPYTATMGHRVPSNLDVDAQSKAFEVIEQVFSSLGVSAGPFDCDFVVDRGAPVLIEMTPRLGGNSISNLFNEAFDYDLVGYAVRYACGDEFILPEPSDPKPASIAILGVERSGKLLWNESESNALRQEPWVKHLQIDLPKGSMVEPFINGRHRVGEALITGKNREEIDTHLLSLRNRLEITAS